MGRFRYDEHVDVTDDSIGMLLEQTNPKVERHRFDEGQIIHWGCS